MAKRDPNYTVNRQARTEHRVVPRAFSGQLLHNLPRLLTPFGEVQAELYLADPEANRCVSLFRSGTRVIEDVTEIEDLRQTPWQGGFLQGVIDAPFLNLSPGTRLGVIRDDRFETFLDVLPLLQVQLQDIIEQQQKAAEEKANQNTLKSIQRAFHEAMLALPEEDYDWFNLHKPGTGRRRKPPSPGGTVLSDGAQEPSANETSDDSANGSQQAEFFEHAGQLNFATFAASSPKNSCNTTFLTLRRNCASRFSSRQSLGVLLRLSRNEPATFPR